MLIKKVSMAIVVTCLAINASGCGSILNSLTAKAAKNSEERAAKFNNDELCKHVKEDTNEFFTKANAKEVEHRKLKCK